MDISNTVNFKELVRANNMDFSLGIQSKLVTKLHENFHEEEQRWYAANLYIYMKFHPTEDFPIELDNVFAMIGFSTKGNAKKTLVNNFTKDVDYKMVEAVSNEGSCSNEGNEVNFAYPFAKAKNKEGSAQDPRGGSNKEKILLNTETFKNLCMIARTEMGKKIRTYYVKLEAIYNGMIKETINEMKELQLAKNKEIEKKNNEINQLTSKIENLQEHELNHIYIAWNPKIKGIHKIGISSDIMMREEAHKSSNPDFVYLYTYETKDAKTIEDGVKFLLKNFKVKKPEWFKVDYKQIKSVLDFCVMMYENYSVHKSVEDLTHFIERYRANRLVNTCATRVSVEHHIYNEYFSENIVINENFNTTIGMARDDFFRWYNLKFNGEIKHHLKTPTGEWSTEFTKELLSKMEMFTKIKSKHINVRDRLRGLNLLKHTGFVGVALKTVMDTPGQIYPMEVYTDYVNSKITILEGEPRNKISRMELVNNFHDWIRTSKHTYNRLMFAEVKFAIEFLTEFVQAIETLTGQKYYTDLTKKYDRGCFLNLSHVDLDCNMRLSKNTMNIVNSELTGTFV